jgi:hypothetical protein
VSSVLEDAARARSAEANCLAGEGHLCGAVYLAGYVVECKLKILLGKMGKSFPRAGNKGHDLIGLWRAAGLRDQDVTGFRKAFLDYWNTGIRYTAVVESEHQPEDLLRGAQDLARYVSARIPYVRASARNRGRNS